MIQAEVSITKLWLAVKGQISENENGLRYESLLKACLGLLIDLFYASNIQLFDPAGFLAHSLILGPGRILRDFIFSFSIGKWSTICTVDSDLVWWIHFLLILSKDLCCVEGIYWIYYTKCDFE